MEPTLPPLPPFEPQQPQRRNWWQRNWKWFVPTGCFTLIVLFVAFVVMIMLIAFSALKSSDAYKTAVARAKQDERVIAALGTPMSEGMFISGKTNVEGGSGESDLAIPISGPRGKGKIYAVATKSAGKWVYSKLVVQVEGSGETIDLNEANTGDEIDMNDQQTRGAKKQLSLTDESGASIAAATLVRESGDDFEPVKNFEPADTPQHLIVRMSAGNSGAHVKTIWTNLNAGGAKNQKLWEKELVMDSPKPLADFAFSNANGQPFPVGDYKIDIYLNGKFVQTIQYKVR